MPDIPTEAAPAAAAPPVATAAPTGAPTDAPAAGGGRWLAAGLRILFVLGAGALVWYVAGHWDRWIGIARLQTTDDAYVAGDLTPLSAKVSGYVAAVPVGDYQQVHRGDLLVEIEPSDYAAQLAQANANVAAAQATLDNLANQRDVQQALVRQAQANVEATAADLQRYTLEANRQRNLLEGRVAGTAQQVEQADDNQRRTTAQLKLNQAQLDQQKALLAAIDTQQKQLEAQLAAEQAQLRLAQNNLGYTRILAPADGQVGQRQVRPGQFVNVGTQVLAIVPPNLWVIANLKETQMTQVRAGNRARVAVDAFPDLVLSGHVDSWSPGTGSTFALLPPDNATGNFTKVVQRVPVKIVLDPNPALGNQVRAGMSVEATIDTSEGGASGQ